MHKGDHFYAANIEGREEQVLAEADYRMKILLVARTIGCDIQMQALFDKYDRLLKRCTNRTERKAIQTMAIKEASDLLDNGYVGAGGSVVVHHKDETIILVDDYKTRKDAGIL